MSLLFLRHAESASNAGGVTMRNEEIPLSPFGQAQAHRLSTELEVQPTAVIVSRFPRTLETAQPLCARIGLTAQTHPLLHEFCAIDPALIADMTLAQRRPATERYWNEADPNTRMGTDAESFHEFVNRVEAIHADLHQLPDGALIVTHGMWLSLLIWKLLGHSTRGSIAMRNFRRFTLALPMHNCAIYWLERTTSGHWAARYDEARSFAYTQV